MILHFCESWEMNIAFPTFFQLKGWNNRSETAGRHTNSAMEDKLDDSRVSDRQRLLSADQCDSNENVASSYTSNSLGRDCFENSIDPAQSELVGVFTLHKQ